MRTYLSGLFCLCLFFNACAQGKKTVESGGTPNTTTASPASAADGRKPGRDITSMTMQRTSCFGRCPSYHMQLFSDGRAIYTGEMFTENLGTFEKNVGAANVQELLRRAQTLRVDTCAEMYEMMISDLPGLNFSFTRAQGTQEIRNAHFGPRYLKGLAADVDSLVKVDKTWRKTAEPKK